MYVITKINQKKIADETNYIVSFRQDTEVFTISFVVKDYEITRLQIIKGEIEKSECLNFILNIFTDIRISKTFKE